jgi:hypothetical protein
MKRAKLLIEAEFDVTELEEIKRIVSDELGGFASVTKALVTIPAETIFDIR